MQINGRKILKKSRKRKRKPVLRTRLIIHFENAIKTNKMWFFDHMTDFHIYYFDFETGLIYHVMSNNL